MSERFKYDVFLRYGAEKRSTVCSATRPAAVAELIWPNGAPGSEGRTTDEVTRKGRFLEWLDVDGFLAST